jgi:hypothetical protein
VTKEDPIHQTMEVPMSKLAKDVHLTTDKERLFVGPNVPRFPTEKGGEVIVLEPIDDLTPAPDQDKDEA